MEAPEPPRRRREVLSTALIVEDFRSVRRWLALLGVVSLASLVLAVLAFSKAVDSEQESADRQRVVRLERTLRDRLSELQATLRRTGEESDVTRLQRELRRKADAGDLRSIDRRLRRAEDDVVGAVDGAADSGRAVSRLDERIDALEDRRGP